MDDSANAITAPIDLGDRVKLRFIGEDRVRFLNGQVSNDVRRVDDQNALPACVCNLKGKLDALVYITASGSGVSQALLVDGPAELRDDDELFHRFDRYLIADQVELDDVGEEYALWHFLPGVDRPDTSGAVWKACNRFGLDGHDLWLTADSVEKLRPDRELLTPDDDRVENLRIRHRVPVWGKELSAEILPAEARLNVNAIDFHKGCYTGQEVVSRIQSVGRVNRILSLLKVVSGEKIPAPGDELFPQAEAEVPAKAIGRITSVSGLPATGETLALAYLRRGHDETGTTLRLVSPGQSVTLDETTLLEVREV